MKVNIMLPPDQEEILYDPDRYQKLVSKLNYLTVIRLDITFAVS